MGDLLIKKTSIGVENVFPNTYIERIKDKETSLALSEILKSFNMYFISYYGNVYLTRILVPKSIRRRGLWIVYVNKDNQVITEWYDSDNIDNESWGSDSNWRYGSNMLVGDISISSDGYWVIKGELTKIKAQGETGTAPILRIYNNRFQVSYDNLKTWQYLSLNPVSSLYIKGYVSGMEKLPKDASIGDIYMVGPTYDSTDTTHDYPHYRMWIKQASGWIDNGEFTAITAGITDTLGDSKELTISQLGITKALSDIRKLILDRTIDINEFTVGKWINTSNYPTFDSDSQYLRNINPMFVKGIKYNLVLLYDTDGRVVNLQNSGLTLRFSNDSGNLISWEYSDSGNSIILQGNASKLYIYALLDAINSLNGCYFTGLGSLADYVKYKLLTISDN